MASIPEESFAQGGYTPGGPTRTVTARTRDGQYEYWEPELNRWVPVIRSADLADWAKKEADRG